MRPDGIVVPSPGLDHDPCLLPRVEDLTIGQLITKLSIEALAIPCDLPGSFCTKRIDRNWLGKELGHAEEETDAGADSDAAAAD